MPNIYMASGCQEINFLERSKKETERNTSISKSRFLDKQLVGFSLSLQSWVSTR